MSIEPVLITKEQLKNAQIISPYERLLDDGTRINTNAKGDISNRLLSWQIKEVQRNRFTDRKNIKAYLNLVNVPRKWKGMYVPTLRMGITMQDLKGKADYMIPINIGAILNIILMRSKIKKAQSINELKNDFLRQHYDEIITTQLYKDMLIDYCKFPVIIEKEENDDNNKVRINTKINVTNVDYGIPVLMEE